VEITKNARDSLRHALPVSAFVLTALAAVATAQENAWTSHGPTDVGWINDLAIVDSVAYAATLNGVFRSTDGGVSWQSAGLTGQSILRIAAPSGTATVVALLTGVWPSPNLYVSQDSGQTWTSVPGQDSAFVLGIDPERPSNVYFGSAGDGSIWKSTDAGASWQQVSAIPGNGRPLALALNSNAIYVLTYDNLYRSLDGGVGWTAVQPSLGAPNSIAAGAAAGVVYAAGNGGFCRSADSAATWTCSTSLAPYYASRILEFPGDSPATPRLLVATMQGVFFSDDGAKWKRVAGDLGSATLPALASSGSGSLVLAGTDTQVFRSQDHGDTWTPASAGLSSARIDAVALDPQNSSTVWAGGVGNWGSGPGLFRSTDASLSWSPAGGSGGPRGVKAIAIDSDHPMTMYAGWDAVFRTEDGGQTWASSSLPGVSQGLYVLALDPGSRDRIWAGSGGGLYKSDDGARTWEPASIAQGIYSLLFDDRHPGMIYAGSYWDVSYDYYGVEGGSIWVSHDHGASFTKGAFNFPDIVLALAEDPFDDGVLYAASGNAGALRSADGGATWENASLGLPYRDSGPYAKLLSLYSPVLQLVADPVRPGRLYCATLRGVFRTIDGARTWQPFSNGLTSLQTEELVISPDGRRLYAGTAGGGVFELDLIPSFPCVPNATRLCLLGNRYAVDLLASRPGESQYVPGAARPLNDRAGYFGLPFATGDPDLPEVVVKMLGEGTFGAAGAPVFYSSLTTLPYSLTVTDTVTGEQQFYASHPGAPLCGGVDTAFGTAEASLSLRAGPAAAAEETALPLLGGRFSVTLEARDPRSSQTVSGVAMSSGDRFGFFSLPDLTGDPQFPEVVVKMIDTRAIAGKFWFFYTGLTSLDYTLTVTDTVTGAVRTYLSATAFCGGADTQAFTDFPQNLTELGVRR
jgi:photosystem II stability/assembly factor-like uncharacterized protein